jgi:uncharacterized protein with ParB-like and HNH nuclease domain
MPISELTGKMFTVGDYQRGYRWSHQQIIDLLKDIKEFIDDEKNNSNVYCLQPIVVIEKEGNECELVDGQQRLTTIFVILSYIDKCIFSIQKQSKESRNTFLTDFIEKNDKRLLKNDWATFINENPEFDNVDNYHLYHAYNFIHCWFEEENNKKYKDCSIFLNRVGVIYYEPEITDGQSPEKIFRNINSNKIELTNAELIKGILIINGVKEIDNIHNLYKQLEIAKEWDRIENALQNDQLWYFLNPLKSYRNRIEFLFELYESIYIKNNQNDKKDIYFLFHSLNDKNLNHVWTETVQIFNIITDWFNPANLEMYHFVGYVISAELFTINQLIESWNSKNKELFLKSLKNEIANKIGDTEKITLATYKQRKQVSKILLLHNILSLRQKDANNILGVNWTSMFRFDLYIAEKWSLEHVHAQNEAPQDTYENLKPWIGSTINSLKLSHKYIDVLEEYNDLARVTECEDIVEWAKLTESVPKLYILIARISEFLSKISEGEEDKDKIENLALLSQSINSSIGNGYFNEKRAAVIECDKQGKYLLPTTKNVFLKFYTETATNPYEWGADDKKAYLEDIIKKISGFRKEINQ